MRRKRLLWQLYPSYLLVVVLSLLAVTWYTSEAVRAFYREQAEAALASRARVLGQYVVERILSPDPAAVDAFCKEIGRLGGERVTVILPSGVVVGDSEAEPAAMENHADRPEIVAALAGRLGSSVRESPTLKTPMMYVAVAARDDRGNRIVLRTAMSLSHIDETVRALQMRIALVGAGIALLAAFLSLLVSRRIARPIEEMKRGVERLAGGEPGRRLHVPEPEELRSLAQAINEMAAQLEERIRLITAQRNEQEAVFSSMVEGVLAVDAGERLLRMNRAAGRLLRVEPAAAQGRAIQEVVRNSDLQAFVAESLASAAPTEAEFCLRDGGELWLQAHGAALNDPAGRRIGAVVVLNDVTRIRRLESFRRDFVGNVAHELRTPVTAIKGFVETLLEGAVGDPKSATRFLGIVSRQADRLNAIIGDLLLLSRLQERGEREGIAKEEAAVRPILDAAFEVCAPKAQEKGIAVSIRCAEDLRAEVNVPLLEQAVVNLVDNAVKYSEPGKPVSVEAERDGESLFIRVRDEGCGIAAEHVPRIFERFYRVDRGRSREMGGTGLGLAIVKHIAQVHGGVIAVESAPGKGSVFTLSLPAK